MNGSFHWLGQVRNSRPRQNGSAASSLLLEPRQTRRVSGAADLPAPQVEKCPHSINWTMALIRADMRTGFAIVTVCEK